MRQISTHLGCITAAPTQHHHSALSLCDSPFNFNIWYELSLYFFNLHHIYICILYHVQTYKLEYEF